MIYKNAGECRLISLPNRVNGIMIWERIATDSRGTVVLTSGFPPSESGDVLGLSSILCQAGWRVIQYQPPGSWMSSGTFSLREIADTINEILSSETILPRILIGHSAGGLFNFAALSLNPSLEGIIAIAAPNGAVMAADFMALPDFRAGWIQQFDYFTGSGKPVHSGSGEHFASELVDMKANLDFESLALKLMNIRALFVNAARDKIIPSDRHLEPYRSIMNSSNAKFSTVDTDHDFMQDREILVNLILEWLDEFPSDG